MTDINNQKDGRIWIGASSVGCLMGSTSNGFGYKTRIRYWKEKTGREEKEDVTGLQMFGKENEPRAIHAMECDLGLVFQHTGDNQKQYGRDVGDHVRVVAHPDGEVHEEIFAEAKCITVKLRDHIRPKGLIQCQMYYELCPTLKAVIYSEWTPAAQRHWLVRNNPELGEICWDYINKFITHLVEDTEPRRWTAKANPAATLPPTDYEQIFDGRLL